MGGRLVTQIADLATLGHLSGLTDRDRWVLALMASIARDEPKGDIGPGIYYGGWEMLARGLGYLAYTPAAERAVARSIAALIKAGLIKPLGKAGQGNRQAYRLTLSEAF